MEATFPAGVFLGPRLAEPQHVIMFDADVHAASLAQLEALNPPVTFTWSGAEYPCLRGALRRSRDLGPGGLSLDADLVLIVRAALFGEGPRPDSKQTILFAQRRYRIQDVLTPTGEPFLKLVCMDADRAA